MLSRWCDFNVFYIVNFLVVCVIETLSEERAE